MNGKEKDIVKGSSFLVKIKYSENNSIQGSIHWLEKKKIVNFRSMMELMMLLSESISKEELRSWEDKQGKLEILENISNK
ncbi:MAG: hypothetical protein H0S78_01920 [Tissierellales bacterium]|jgi:hypothetical protein|nr:hypothetical protein [Tissierellales bacterium]